MKMIKSVLLIVPVLLLACGVSGDFQAGMDAYDSGDYETALKEWRPLAEEGNADAQYWLGFMYLDGEGVPEDYAEAMKWFLLSAEQGNAEAQISLGYMYDDGEGVPEDDAEAVKWYRLAAEQGLAEAQRYLGDMYDNGEGVPEDRVSAYMWFNIAESQGEFDARRRKERVGEEMSQSQIAEAQRLSRECIAKDYKDC